jgi:hypothetical protein
MPNNRPELYKELAEDALKHSVGTGSYSEAQRNEALVHAVLYVGDQLRAIRRVVGGE